MRKHLYPYILIGIFLAVALWSVHAPVSMQDWLVEISLIFLFFGLFTATGFYFRLSKLSCTLFTLYMIFPMIGAHYTIVGIPFGNTIGHWFGSTRNDYDRFVHFLFGFLLFYPVLEVVARFSGVKRFWKYFFPVAILGMFSMLYEIFEWIVAVRLSSKTADSFLGAQGDIWDTQKDMWCAFLGSLSAIIVILAIKWLYKKYWQSSEEARPLLI